MPTTTPFTFSFKRLRKAREDLNLSIPDAYKEFIREGADVSIGALYSYEGEERVPSANLLPFFSRVYKKPMEYFFDA